MLVKVNEYNRVRYLDSDERYLLLIDSDTHGRRQMGNLKRENKFD